jgi:alpha-mannosidase
MSKPQLLVIRSNHFDHLWRRAWRERITDNGQVHCSYSQITGWYMDDNLALAAAIPDYRFEAESAIILREYLRQQPQRAAELRRLADEGRFIVTSGGETICDSNLVLGETLVRNWLIGQRYVEQVLGRTSPQVVRNDAFGNSAQLPQILRGFGLTWATGLGYSPVLGRYWRGLDGSVVCTATLPIGQWGGDTRKLRPCPACHGHGCPACAGRGIADDPIQPHEFLWPTHEEQGRPLVLDAAKREATEGDEHHFGAQVPPFQVHDTAQYRFTPEELLPGKPEPLLAWFGRMQADYRMRWALSDETQAWLTPWFDRLDTPDPAQVHPEAECNPNNAGCFVSRIRTKQELRALEHRLLRTEALAALAGLPAADLEPAWHGVLIGAFHDAVTGTSVDPAVDELHRTFAAARTHLAGVEAGIGQRLLRAQPGTATLVNAGGLAATAPVRIPVAGVDALLDGVRLPVAGRDGEGVTVIAAIPALAAQGVTLVPAVPATPAALPAPVITNEYFTVTADAKGILEVVDRRLGVPVLSALGAAQRIAQPIIERDLGSPWATLHPDRRRVPLALRLERAEQDHDAQRLVFAFAHHGRLQGNSRVCEGTLTATLVAGLPRLLITVDLDWAAHDERLRLAFPTMRRGRSIHGIPFGHLERPPYAPRFHETTWDAANGDWPVVDWAALEARDHTVGLLTRGLASVTTEHDERANATLLVSCVRSPGIPTYLHCEGDDGTTRFQGMRDHGRHRFELAIASHAGAVADGDLPLQAEAFNGGLRAWAGCFALPPAPRITGDGVRITALKPAEDGDGLILRVAECRGRAAQTTLVLPPGMTAVGMADLAERPAAAAPAAAGGVPLALGPWRIASLRLRRSGTGP